MDLLRYWGVQTLSDMVLQCNDKGNKRSDGFKRIFPLGDRTPTGEVKNKLPQMALHSAAPDESAKRMCQSVNRFSSTSVLSPGV